MPIGLFCLLPFALIGPLSASSYFDLFEWLTVQSWTEVPATLNEIELKSYFDGEGTRQSIRGQFNYTVDGVEYSSERISLRGGEGFPVSPVQTVRKFEPRVGQPDATSCYVNPSEPSQAILLRDSGWERYPLSAIIALAVGSVFIVLLLFCIYALKIQLKVGDRKATFPNEPWRWNESWQQGKISAEFSRSFLLVAVSAWWLIILLPSVIFSVAEITKGNWFGWSVVIPFILAIAILFFAIRRYLFSKLFTAGELELHGSYFQIGSTTKAVCVFPLQLFPNDLVRTQLRCWATNQLWDDEQCIMIMPKACQKVGDKFHLPVSVTIPAGAPCSDVLGEDGAVWKLSVNVPSAKGNFTVNFELPVFDNIGGSKNAAHSSTQPAKELVGTSFV